jgi:mono/diheme cytochrome c family protein
MCITGCSGPAAPRVAAVPSGTMADPARGEMLYENACAECHTKQTHWRAVHLVRDWPSLLQQINRWQGVAGQNWSAREIEDVGAYLNRQFYGLPCPLPRCSAGTVG